MSKRSSSSHRWLARQRRDPFVRRAAAEGQASRAHFKLEQLDRRFGLLRPGMTVLELGAAPGGWSRYVAARLGDGLLVACDPRAMDAGALRGAAAKTVIIEGAYGDAETGRRLAAVLGGRTVDLVLSDMAPNMTGNRATDQARAMELADLALDGAERWLKPGGGLAVKLFQGEGFDAWVAGVRRRFARVRISKPDASRAGSREVYLVAQGYGEE